MPKSPQQTPLGLATALVRYSRMPDAGAAYTALHREWPPEVAHLADKVLVCPLRSGPP